MRYFVGLQGFYGGESLKSNMDQQEEIKVIESTLWKRFVDYQYVVFISFFFICS
jgi:hypothetical protein